MEPRFRKLSEVDGEFFSEFVPKQERYREEQWKRVLWALEQVEQVEEPWPMDQLKHALLCADLARADGADDELVLCALCHDVGKIMGYERHGELSAEMLRPYISQVNFEILRAHQEFEAYHCRQHLPHLGRVREIYASEPWFEQAIQFSEWDQAAFDVTAKTSSLADYVDLIRQVCRSPEHRIVAVSASSPRGISNP